MDNSQEYWEKTIRTLNPYNSQYDGWLDKYFTMNTGISPRVIELGCGWGDDTAFLSKLNIELLSCDFSVEAIKIIKERFPQVKTSIFDMRSKFPLEDASADYIIADLCLHYFNNSQLEHIAIELKRVLTNKGIFLCRVNSDKDSSFIYHKNSPEEGLVLTEDGYKRFFNRDLIYKVFNSFKIILCDLYEIKKYPVPKIIWEVCLCN